jgi:signal transduction histidine kinase
MSQRLHDDGLTGGLRIAALLLLGSVAVFCPLQVHYVAQGSVPSLLLIFALDVVLATFILLASYTARGERHADLLGVVLVVGLTANFLLYLYLLPAAVPTYPVITAVVLAFLLIGSAVFLSWTPRRLLVVSGATGVGFALVGALVRAGGVHDAPFGLSLATFAVGAAIAVASGATLTRSRTGLAQREAELAALSTRLMTMQEEGWRRLSQELHEEVSQSLSAVLSYLWLIERALPAELAEMRTRATEARRLAAQTVTEIRELSQLLRPSALDDYGLVPTLETFLKGFADRQRIAATLSVDGLPERLPADIETALYRIAQEALTNVARHARATRVGVRLTADGREVHLAVEDDGVGLPAGSRSASPSGTGLIGIRERVRSLGGTVSMDSAGGARLDIRLPLPQPELAAGRTPRVHRAA